MQSSTCKKLRISVIRSGYMNENGAVLVLSLVFMVLLAMVGSTAVVLTTTDMKIGANYKDSEAAFNDAQAGVQYAIGKMEEGLKAWPRTFTLPTSATVANPLISTFTVPSSFRFTYTSEITEISTDPDIYEFVANGTTLQGSTASITARVQRLPAIMFGAFGDEKVDLKNSSSIYAYSHTANPFPDIATYPAGFKVGEADAGSNVAVNLDMGSVVDGNIGLGEDATGTDATDATGQGTYNGTEQDMSRVDPDPLGILGGEYAANFTTYAAANDNLLRAIVAPGDSITTTGASLIVGPGETLTLKGKLGGSNFYWHDIKVNNNSFLYIDTTNDYPVNIYLTGAFLALTGSQVINTTDASCTDPADAAGTAPSCGCCDTANPPNYTCTRGAPGNFSIFANSTTSTDEIVMGNSVEFSGLIYAPYIEIEMKNSADIYGALFGKTVEINAGANLFFDVDMKDKLASNDLAVISWRDNRM